MNIINFLKDQLNMDVFLILIVLLSGFFQEKYLCKFYLSKDTKFDAALKTLIVSLIAGAIYIALVYNEDRTVKLPWAKYFISYFTATSIFELLIRPLKNFFDKKAEDQS